MPEITRQDWETKRTHAIEFMQERQDISKVLIEVSAQHPLKDGLLPDVEFAARLDLGKSLYDQLKKSGIEVEIYVSASRHMHNGIPDKVSLSKAGTDYLSQLRVPTADLHSEDLNKKYKGEEGVYNSGDEAFVAASYFKDGNFGRLLCVLSPAQIPRKPLHYIWNEVFPEFYTAPVAPQLLFHDFIKELYENVPYVLQKDPDFQGEDSDAAKNSRKDRIPEE